MLNPINVVICVYINMYICVRVCDLYHDHKNVSYCCCIKAIIAHLKNSYVIVHLSWYVNIELNLL